MKENPASIIKTPIQVVSSVLTSYGLMVVVLFLMLLLTLFGTLEQVDHGIFDVQSKYFNSLVLIHWIGPVPIPLPGGYLLMAILFLNLLAGAIIKARKDWRHPGMLIAHFGILFLLAGGFVTHYFSTEGNMALYENEASDEFISFYHWQMEIAKVDDEGKRGEILVIPHEQLVDTAPGEQRQFYSGKLPFEVVMTGYLRNSRVIPESGPAASGDAVSRAVDGFLLQPVDKSPEAERNIAGAYVTLKHKQTGEQADVILWGGALYPQVIEMGDEKWSVHMVRETWKVPFTVHLDDFTAEWFPGTEIPRVYQSEVTKIEKGVEERIKISMNEPLRHRGYTLFQASWGPEGAGPGDRLFSVFQVVKNPADHWPMYSCWIVGAGLLIHFLQKLAGYLRTAKTKRLAPA